MIEGFDADDAYWTVEDEFLTTANLYTRHLHHAEYQRQKQLASKKNEGAVRNITRPVDGRTTLSAESRKTLEGSKQRLKGRIAITNVFGNGMDDPGEEEDDPWLRDPRLAGLMSQKETSAPLAKITGTQSTSRAARGYSQRQRSPIAGQIFGNAHVDEVNRRLSFEFDEDSSDDLDAPSYRAPVSLQSQTPQPIRPLRTQSIPKKPLDKIKELPYKAKAAVTKIEEAPTKSRLPPAKASPGENDDEDDADLFHPFPLRRYHPNESKAIAKAQALTKRKKEEDKRKQLAKAEEIPTFLV
jgi:hypothetical protein